MTSTEKENEQLKINHSLQNGEQDEEEDESVSKTRTNKIFRNLVIFAQN